MPKNCCVLNCKVQSNEETGRNLSFFSVPTDEKTKLKWTGILSGVGVQVKRYIYVCSRHFEAECFHNSNSSSKLQRLVRGSYPTIFSNFRKTNNRLPESETNIGNNIDRTEFLTYLQEEVKDVNLLNEHLTFPIDENPLRNNSFCSTLFEHHSSASSNERIHFRFNDCIDYNNVCNEIEDHLNELDSETLNDIEINDRIKIELPDDPLDQNKTEVNIQNISNFTNENSLKKDDESLVSQKQTKSNKISLAHIDLDAIDYSRENLDKIRNILKDAKREIISLRRKNRCLQTKILRWKKGIKLLLR